MADGDSLTLFTSSFVGGGGGGDDSSIVSAPGSLVSGGPLSQPSAAGRTAESSFVNSTVATLPKSEVPNALQRLIGQQNNKYQREKYLRRVTSKAASKAPGPAVRAAGVDVLVPPPPIRPERSFKVVNDMLHEAHRNRAPECELYCPTEGKFLCIRVDADTGKHAVLLLEAPRFFPSSDCGRWRVLPADRTSRDQRFLLQNVFSNQYLGHCPRGRVVCDQAMATPVEHLELEADAATGLLKVVFPHWHWERGAPMVVRGEGKRNTSLWPEDTAYLEAVAKLKDTENPPRSLRCGYGGRQDPSARGFAAALLQVRWDLPAHSRRPPSGHTGLGGAGHGVHLDAQHAHDTSAVNLNWLGQRATDFSHVLHAQEARDAATAAAGAQSAAVPAGLTSGLTSGALSKPGEDAVWLSPYRARTRGLLP